MLSRAVNKIYPSFSDLKYKERPNQCMLFPRDWRFWYRWFGHVTSFSRSLVYFQHQIKRRNKSLAKSGWHRCTILKQDCAASFLPVWFALSKDARCQATQRTYACVSWPRTTTGQTCAVIGHAKPIFSRRTVPCLGVAAPLVAQSLQEAVNEMIFFYLHFILFICPEWHVTHCEPNIKAQKRTLTAAL